MSGTTVHGTEGLVLHAERLIAGKKCRNLMGTYGFYYSAFRFNDAAGLFARRDDSVLVMPWGIYEGYESIRRCFVEQMGDRGNPGAERFLEGKMFLREFNTEILRVAGDGRTARGFYIAMGQDGYLKDNGFPQSDWVWAKYAVEFIDDGGEWRIWKMRIVPVFACPFERAWTEDPAYGGFQFPKVQPDRPLPKPPWRWSRSGAYPADEPEPPQDYETYSDIGYIL